LEKHKTTNQTLFNQFPVMSHGSPVRHLPGKNRKILGARPISQPCPKHYASLLYRLKVGS